MKKITYIIATALLLLGFASCTKNDVGIDISGQWHLVESGDLISGQGLEIDVYASFGDGTFALYQKVGEDLTRYWYYEGTYSVSSDNILTGRYSDGTRLGGTRGLGYTVALSGNELTLTALSSGEVSTYTREEIPSSVIEASVLPVKASPLPAGAL